MMTYQYIKVQSEGNIYRITLNRVDKRNALSDGLLLELGQSLDRTPEDARVIILSGTGEHFCAGLDLKEHKQRSAEQVMAHSQFWHQTFHKIQFGRAPVICAMHGGAIGGGLELACSCHVRVAEQSGFYGLPEAQRGIYVGGGGSVRIAAIIGAHRMAEMMLTGRLYNAEEGQALGISHYLTQAGNALNLARELAEKVSANARLTNYAIMHALPRIQHMSMSDGLFTESLMTALTQTGEEAQAGMAEFLARSDSKADKKTS